MRKDISMQSNHPDVEAFRRFIRPQPGEGTSKMPASKESAGVVVIRHTLGGCKPCQRNVGRLWTEGIPPTPTAADKAYGKLFPPAVTDVVTLDQRLEGEREAAPGLLAELKAHPNDDLETLVRNTPRYQTWGLMEHALTECTELRVDAPQKSLEFARLAVFIAENFVEYPQPLVEDARGRAWGYTGNALRVLDQCGAQEAFRRAHQHLANGTGDPLERANLLSFESSLASQKGDFERALNLLADALRIYRRFGDSHQVGRTLIQEGLNTGYLERHEQAIRMLSLGLQRIDANREPSLVLAARHNLIENLNEAGRTRQALALLQNTRPMYEEVGDDLVLTRLNFLEGRVALSVGNLEEAEGFLLKARDGYLKHGIGFGAAMVSLDLARVLVLERRNTELRQLALEMIPIFETREVHREAFAAFILFRKAVEAEAATLGLVKELARALKQEAANPTLRFQRLEGRSRA
jgi:tetratricopeptide (TPR) repeat protein